MDRLGFGYRSANYPEEQLKNTRKEQLKEEKKRKTSVFSRLQSSYRTKKVSQTEWQIKTPLGKKVKMRKKEDDKFILWMALSLWIPIFLGWTFVGFKICGHSIFLHNPYRKSLIHGFWNSWTRPSTKTTKIGTPRKLSHPQYSSVCRVATTIGRWVKCVLANVNVKDHSERKCFS